MADKLMLYFHRPTIHFKNTVKSIKTNITYSIFKDTAIILTNPPTANLVTRSVEYTLELLADL